MHFRFGPAGLAFPGLRHHHRPGQVPHREATALRDRPRPPVTALPGPAGAAEHGGRVEADEGDRYVEAEGLRDRGLPGEAGGADGEGVRVGGPTGEGRGDGGGEGEGGGGGAEGGRGGGGEDGDGTVQGAEADGDGPGDGEGGGEGGDDGGEDRAGEGPVSPGHPRRQFLLTVR